MKFNQIKHNYFQLILIFSLIILVPVGLIIYKTNTNYFKRINHHYTKTPTHRVRATKLAKPYLKPHIKKFDLHGIDVSKHQGKIKWDLVKHPDSTKKIDFIFTRATYGTKKDRLFHTNWTNASNKMFSLGAYHYYWANANSIKQAQNFIATVSLKKGDLPPVLDVEKLPKFQSKSSWIKGIKGIKGIKNWLKLVETHYGVKPIIYTGDSFYKHHLKPDPFFEKYTRLGISNYNNISQPKSKWHFWQYSDKVKIDGIKGAVDINVFKNDRTRFNELRIK